MSAVKELEKIIKRHRKKKRKPSKDTGQRPAQADIDELAPLTKQGYTIPSIETFEKKAYENFQSITKLNTPPPSMP